MNIYNIKSLPRRERLVGLVFAVLLMTKIFNKMQGITRMDAALDAMRPLGFRTQLILRTVNELLDVGIEGPKSLGLHTLYDCRACTIYDAMFYGNWIKCVDLGKVFGQNRVFDELMVEGKKLVNTKGMLRAAGILEHHSKGILDSDKPRKLLANFQIGKLIIGNIHRLQVMCLIKCQDDIFGYIFLFLIGIFERHVIWKKFSDKFPGITCTCRTNGYRTNGGWSD
ncbi:hypothetical protein GmHk_13G036502 [Glycine max]|nr:hypothetical protein GmHk_13G036502 [Glycine max]